MIINYFSDFCFPGGIPVHQGEIAKRLTELYHDEVRLCVPWPLRYDMDEHKLLIKTADQEGKLSELFDGLAFLKKIENTKQLEQVINEADINHFHGSFSTNREFLGDAISCSTEKSRNIYTFHSECENPCCLSDIHELKKRLDQINVICAVSSSVRDSVMKIVDNKEIVITSNGALAIQSPWAESRRPITILFIGRLNKTKGIENVLRLAKDIKGTKIRLIVVGDAEFDPKYHYEMSDLSSQENILWIDKSLSRNEVLQLYTQADIFYFPSHMEGQSIVVLDAIANGCVPVTSFVGGLSEIISHGINGFLFDYSDYNGQIEIIRKLCQDNDFLTQIKKQTRNIHLPSWDDTAKLLHAIYCEVLNGNAKN